MPGITSDITHGVAGAPFQRSGKERALWLELLAQAEERQVVTVHCRVEGEAPRTELWIDRSTYLHDAYNRQNARLLHAEGIPHHPERFRVGASGVVHFTLYFEGLWPHCKVFDLQERTDNGFPFNVPGIARNRSDVYHVRINYRHTTPEGT